MSDVSDLTADERSLLQHVAILNAILEVLRELHKDDKPTCRCTPADVKDSA